MKLLQFILAVAILSFAGCSDISEKLSSEESDAELTEETEEPDLYLESETLGGNTEELESLEVLEAENGANLEASEKIETTEVAAEVIKEVIKPGKFYIIAGSFKDFKKAENLYKELSSKGYSETKILDPVNDFSRVVIKSFNDENLARAELKKLRKQYNDESIWLLSAK